MSYKFRIDRLEPEDERPEFECSNSDLNEFFHKDSIDYAKQLLSVTYVMYDDANDSKAVAYYCVSNDSIREEDSTRSRFKKLLSLLPHVKHGVKTKPAVKIGRLAVCKEYEHQGIGTMLMDIIKYSFTHNNKTGCRVVIVDANNKPDVIGFYKKNGFDFMIVHDKEEAVRSTRLMLFDLMLFRE